MVKELNTVPRVAVIGSGISGIASAAMLRKEGFQVTIFEKSGIYPNFLEADRRRFSLAHSESGCRQGPGSAATFEDGHSRPSAGAGFAFCILS